MTLIEDYHQQRQGESEIHEQGEQRHVNSEFICPKYSAAHQSKRCSSFADGGTCLLQKTFLCVEYMRGKLFEDTQIQDALLLLHDLPVDTIQPTKAHHTAEKQNDVKLLVHATEAMIQELEAIPFIAVLDVPHLGNVRIVNQLIPDGTRQLTIRQAAILAGICA